MSTQEKPNKVTLYIATHNRTRKKYFGKTTCYFTQEDLQKYYHGSGIYWKKHLKKHGDDVTMEIYGIYNINEAKEKALNFSRENNIVESKLWTNLIEENGLDGKPLNSTVSEETKLKMSKAAKGVKKGKMSEKHKNNIRKSKLNISEETKLKMSKAQKGRTMSDKTKQKMSESAKKVVRTKEWAKNSAIARKGKKRTPEQIQNIKEGLKGKGGGNKKLIYIYDKDNNIMFKSFGNFQKTCLENNLPYSLLVKSLKTKEPIMKSKYAKTIAKNNNQEVFIGWIAKYGCKFCN